MLISDQHRFIFIHIPKTAGSSIRANLTDYALTQPESGFYSILRRFNLPRDYRKFRFRLHSSLQDIQLKMPDDLFANYKKIAFVRNPWDRMVSSYAYKVHGTEVKQRSRTDSFETFINSEFERNKSRQIDYLVNTQGEIGCDFIGRFESIDEDYQKLSDYLQIKLPELSVLNKSKRKSNYQDFYNDKTKQLVADYFQKDIELLGYSF